MNKLWILTTLFVWLQSATGLPPPDPFIKFGQPCDPKFADADRWTNVDKVCTWNAECNPELHICDCPVGKNLTFQDGQCRFMPGTKCWEGLGPECVLDATCFQTRKGTDPQDCYADAEYDIGDFECRCLDKKTCLNEIRHANKPANNLRK